MDETINKDIKDTLNKRIFLEIIFIFEMRNLNDVQKVLYYLL